MGHHHGNVFKKYRLLPGIYIICHCNIRHNIKMHSIIKYYTALGNSSVYLFYHNSFSNKV